jgi:reactive intermediate/imine deaminase
MLPSLSKLSVLATLFLTVMQMPVKEIVSVGPAPASPYSTAVKAGGLIYLSGTLSQDAAGALVGPGDIAVQTRRTLERMQTTLTAAGSSMSQVLSVAVYLTSAGDFQAMNDVYRTFFPKDPPTRTTVITDLVLSGALIEISMVAAPEGAERRVIHPSAWMASPNPYSYAIKSGDMLFLAGLVSRNGRDNAPVPGDVAAQTKVIMNNAGELLAAAGMTHANVVASRVYLTDGATFEQMNGAYRGFFPSAPPARATVIAGLAGAQFGVEITMTASSLAKEVVNSPASTNPNLSPGIRAGKRLFLSGMLGNTPETKGNVAAQTRETLARIRTALTAAGGSPADVVDSMVYLTDVKAFDAMNGEYRPFFGRDFPARATVKTGLVAPDGLVEIMMTAVTR